MIYELEVKLSEYASTGGVAVDIACPERMEYVQLCYKECGSRLDALQEAYVILEAALHNLDSMIARERYDGD